MRVLREILPLGKNGSLSTAQLSQSITRLVKLLTARITMSNAQTQGFRIEHNQHSYHIYVGINRQ